MPKSDRGRHPHRNRVIIDIPDLDRAGSLYAGASGSLFALEHSGGFGRKSDREGDVKENAKLQIAIIGGYALLLVFFGLFTGRVNLLFFGENVTDVFPRYAHSAELGQVCCLFIFALGSFARRHLAERFVPHAAFALLVSGYALTLYQAMGSGLPPALPYAAGALFGCGQGACFLCWFMVYARLSTKDIVRTMVASTVLSGIILLAIGCIPDTVLLFSVLSLVVAGSCALSYYCLGAVPCAAGFAGRRGRLEETDDSNGGQGGIDRQREPDSRERDGRRFLSWLFMERRSLLCLIAIAFVCGAQRVVSLEGFLPQAAVQTLFSVGYLGGAVAFWATGKMPGTKDTYYGVYSVLLVVMATCGVLSSVPNVQVQATLYAVDNIAFTIVSMCMILMALKAVREFWPNPLFVGGIVCGIMYFAIQLGRMVCNVIAEVIGMDTIGIFIVSVIILYVVALAAISSGLFFRQAAKSGGVMEPAEAEGDKETDGPLQRVVISVANVTEDELRENPVYRKQYKLTDREIDVAVLLLAGYNSTDIAKILTISVNTVKTHLKNLYAKTDVHNRRELIELLNEIESAT